MARLTPCPVEVVVKLRRLVKGQVRRDRLVVNERRDVILHEIRVHRADPLRCAPQQFGHYQCGGHQCAGPQYWRPGAAGGDGRGDPVDQRPGEVDDGDRKKSLRNQKCNPGRRPVGRRAPDQAERSEKVRQRAFGAEEVSGNGGPVCFLKAGHETLEKRIGQTSPEAKKPHRPSKREAAVGEQRRVSCGLSCRARRK